MIDSSQIDQLLARIRATIAADEAQAASIAQTQAQQTAPVRTGRLRRSIRRRARNQVVAGAPYARYVNARNPYFDRGYQAAVDYLRQRGYR